MKKIIISTVVLALVLCLGISALVLALIPVGANDKVQVPHAVYIYNAETQNHPMKRISYANIDGQEEQLKKLNKIYNAFNHGFQQKALSALFNGELDLGTEVNYSKSLETMSKNYKETNKFTVVFYYKDKQMIKYDGKEYGYNYLFFEVSSKNERAEVIMGLNTTLSSDEGSGIETINYNYYLKTKANFVELYNYLSDLVL